MAEDLVARKMTSPKHLGIMGGSNGGLLVGRLLHQRPDLFEAVVCQVPLLDMRRYNKLLAGASWMDEYGNPDKPEDWAYIQTWSPYHLLKKGSPTPRSSSGPTPATTGCIPATPARWWRACSSRGIPVYYFENTEGGHGSGTTNRQTAQVNALEFAYLWKMLR